MQTYSVQISGDKWPSTFTIEASGWGTAVARAVREWQKKVGRGSRTQQLSIKAFKASKLHSDE